MWTETKTYLVSAVSCSVSQRSPKSSLPFLVFVWLLHLLKPPDMFCFPRVSCHKYPPRHRHHGSQVTEVMVFIFVVAWGFDFTTAGTHNETDVKSPIEGSENLRESMAPFAFHRKGDPFFRLFLCLHPLLNCLSQPLLSIASFLPPSLHPSIRPHRSLQTAEQLVDWCTPRTANALLAFLRFWNAPTRLLIVPLCLTIK